MNCLICKLELPPDYALGPYHYEECDSCIYCNELVQRSTIEDLVQKFSRLSDEQQAIEILPSGKIAIYHPYCHQQKLENDFKNKPVLITQGHLDMLNAANLMFRANLQLSIETNQQSAEIESRKWIHELSLEEKFVALKRMEAVAAMLSIALSKDKSRIQTKLAELERVNLKDLKNSEDRIEFEADRIKKREKEALKLSPEARAEKKTIDSMIKMGISADDAKAMLQAQKDKRVQ